MMADYDKMVAQADWVDQGDQVDLYYRHSFGIGVCFKNFAYEEFGSEPQSVESSKRNQDSSSNLGYMYLRMDC